MDIILLLYSHFHLSSLISMFRMQSGPGKKARKKEKVVTSARDYFYVLVFRYLRSEQQKTAHIQKIGH